MEDIADLVPQVATICNPENYFFPKGCNQGIQKARGEVVVLLNVDTKVRKNEFSEKPLTIQYQILDLLERKNQLLRNLLNKKYLRKLIIK